MRDRTERRICGLDEAGRGPLAGPLVAAAVVFEPGFSFAENFPALPFRDSKKLSRIQRERLIAFIHEFGDVATEVISVEEINTMRIGWANRIVFERLILRVDADDYIVDGNLKLHDLGRKARHVHSQVRADETEQAVMAASIVAKVKRDQIMRDFHNEYPVYGWDHNMGYGTPAHIAAIREHGACEHHRRQFVTTALSHDATPPLPGILDDPEDKRDNIPPEEKSGDK